MKALRILFLGYFSLLSVLSFAQNHKTISGTVKGDDGQVLAGATVVVDGGGYSVADNAGHYAVRTTGEENITVSFFGYNDYVFKAVGGGSF